MDSVERAEERIHLLEEEEEGKQPKEEVRINIPEEEGKQQKEEDQVWKTYTFKSEFKRFDAIHDSWFTDHHYYYLEHKSFSQQAIERLSRERDILKNGLPDSIFVRANKEKPDLLRAVIVGPEGTAHQDGLFFFDIYIPSNFPSVPPIIHSIHEGGSKEYYIPQPNFWTPSRSTLLESLVSMHEYQVLREESISFDKSSQIRHMTQRESVFKFNWRTMVDVLNKPPMCFESFVAGHFYESAERILITCKTYINERVSTVDHPYIKPPRPEDFKMMQSLYYQLVDVFQKNGSSLDHLSKLQIEFHIQPEVAAENVRGETVPDKIACAIIVIFMMGVFVYFMYWSNQP